MPPYNPISSKIQLMIDTELFRSEELKLCKTQEAKDKLLDRWSQEDSAEKIADAIRSAGRMNHHRFLGIF